jgi:6-phospho-beta-glucosidase
LGAYDKLENGQVHDDYRIEFLKAHIELIPQILSEGIQLIGYNP